MAVVHQNQMFFALLPLSTMMVLVQGSIDCPCGFSPGIHLLWAAHLHR